MKKTKKLATPERKFRHVTVRRAGQRHNDVERAIDVIVLDSRKRHYGVRLNYKLTGESVTFGLTGDGARLLMNMLGKVMRGNVQRWKETKWVHVVDVKGIKARAALVDKRVKARRKKHG